MSYYTGTTPFDGLTPKQVAAIEAATRTTGDPALHDGFWRGVRDKLVGDAPWTNSAVIDAVEAMFDELDVAYLEDES